MTRGAVILPRLAVAGVGVIIVVGAVMPADDDTSRSSGSRGRRAEYTHSDTAGVVVGAAATPTRPVTDATAVGRMLGRSSAVSSLNVTPAVLQLFG